MAGLVGVGGYDTDLSMMRRSAISATGCMLRGARVQGGSRGAEEMKGDGYDSRAAPPSSTGFTRRPGSHRRSPSLRVHRR
jgi:hypothetical protein